MHQLFFFLINQSLLTLFYFDVIKLIADPSKISTFFGVNKWLNLSKNRTIVRKLHNAREVNNSLYITKIT